jgi:HPr kinase/phosphorylase
VTPAPHVLVERLLSDPRIRYLEFDVVAGRAGLVTRAITNPRIQKPGLALAGYLPYVKPGRLQILSLIHI